MKWLKGNKKIRKESMLHETYLDKNVSEGVSINEGEGRLEYPISKWYIISFFLLITLGVILLLIRVGFLQIVEGKEYFFISENNTFAKVDVLPVRGTILDRKGEPLAWNVINEDYEYPLRHYKGPGFSSLLGFIRYPQKDVYGEYFRVKTEGIVGLEKYYDDDLSGRVGSIVSERKASGDLISELYLDEPEAGMNVKTSIDSGVQKSLYNAVRKIVQERNFLAGTGVVLDVETGELLSLVSYPDYDNNILTNKHGEEQDQYISKRNSGEEINRAISGLYLPGSTIKPFFALGALEENIVTPDTRIVSNGYITIRNPYDPDIVYTYKDRKAFGSLDLYEAISLSSNIYFYHIGGGYDHITKPLGIDRIEYYARIFGFGKNTNIKAFSEPEGIIPNPKWKEDRYNQQWTVGDTYNTVIGQYDFQTTPLQLARATAAIANGGYYIEPHLSYKEKGKKVSLGFKEENIDVIHKAMRKVITEGTGEILLSPNYRIAGKTGTSQIGNKGLTNSLLLGFFPYEKPKYAFVIIMERGFEYGVLQTARIFFDDLVEKELLGL